MFCAAKHEPLNFNNVYRLVTMYPRPLPPPEQGFPRSCDATSSRVAAMRRLCIRTITQVDQEFGDDLIAVRDIRA
jgi:hypothetical protein